MWSIDVVPNNGSSCLAWEEQYQTPILERKRNARRGVWGYHAKNFWAKLRPVISVIE